MNNLKDLTKQKREKILCRQVGDDTVFTSVWVDVTEENRLEDDELLPGELSAVTFTLGCYTVRSAERVYKVPVKDEDYENPVPADDKDLAFVKGSINTSSPSSNRTTWLDKKDMPNTGFFKDPFSSHSPWEGKLHITHEITARHNSDPKGVFAGNFKYVCRAIHQASTYGDQDIYLISTLKKDASLFVLWRNSYITAIFKKGYRLDPNGVITEYQDIE